MALPYLIIHELEDATANFEAIAHMPAWTVVTAFTNGYTSDPTSTVEYLKDPMGFVHVRGRVVWGTNAAVAWTFPPTFRPGDQNIGPLTVDGGVIESYYELNTIGQILFVFTSGAPAGVWLTSIIPFLAEN